MSAPRKKVEPEPKAVELLPEDEQPTDVAGMLAWIKELMADVPEEEWDKFPRDGSVNHDHYLYGLPKQQP